MRIVSWLGLLQAAAVVTIVFSLVTMLPLDHHALQLFTHFRLQYFAIALLLGIAFMLLRDPAYASALLLVAVANGVWVVPWYFGKDDSANGESLKVLHANVLRRNTEHDRVLRLIDEEAPDLVVLQEVSRSWADAMQALNSAYPHRYVEPRASNFGIAMYSKFPLAAIRHVASPPLDYPTIVADAMIGQQPLRIVASHPMIPLGRSFYEARNDQLDHLQELLEDRDGAAILVGDMNASQWEIKYREFEKTTALRNVRQGHGVLPTWPTWLPIAMIPIDHVLVSEDIAVVEVSTGPRIGSDHLPLVVTISL